MADPPAAKSRDPWGTPMQLMCITHINGQPPEEAARMLVALGAKVRRLHPNNDPCADVWKRERERKAKEPKP